MDGTARRDRGVSATVGVVVLVGLVVAGTAGLVAVVPAADMTEPPSVGLGLTVDPGTGRVALTHQGGEPLSVSRLSVTVRVEGEPLTHQPPVPFFAAVGSEPGPTGPFNSAATGVWEAGETAGVRVASTNSPTIAPGDTVTVVVRTDAGVVAGVETVA